MLLSRYCRSLLAVAALCLPWQSVYADYRDMRNIAPANYRATPEGKLAAAKLYAERFLAEDARPDQVFFTRQVVFPMWEDQPDDDCSTQSIIRAIKPQAPHFEDARKKVVVLPVWVEILMVDAHIVSGPEVTGTGKDSGKDGRSTCYYEYERYSFTTGKFESVPDFRKKNQADVFQSWGDSIMAFGDLNRYVSLDRDKRYVRFNFRISVEREQPYQLPPQFPKHFLAQDAINRLKQIIRENSIHLSKGTSRFSDLTGKELEDDLERMRRQMSDNLWTVSHLESSLDQLKDTPSFSEIKP